MEEKGERKSEAVFFQIIKWKPIKNELGGKANNAFSPV